MVTVNYPRGKHYRPTQATGDRSRGKINKRLKKRTNNGKLMCRQIDCARININQKAYLIYEKAWARIFVQVTIYRNLYENTGPEVLEIPHIQIIKKATCGGHYEFQ